MALRQTSEPTGFRGQVLGVTADATATYVLYFTATQIRIGKRTNAGAYSSRAVANRSGVGPPDGDVIARNGGWFGVWSMQVGPGGELARHELFSAGTGLPVRRVTTTSRGLHDLGPTLAYSGTVPVLIWSRLNSSVEGGSSNLMVKKYVGGTWEPGRIFASLGANNYSPDMTIRGRITFVTWIRDGRIMVASNPGGTFTSHRFLTSGFDPQVAASTTAGAVDHVFVTWTANLASGLRVFFAESASTGSVQRTWDGTSLAPARFVTFGVGAFATKATVVYPTATGVVARSQT